MESALAALQIAQACIQALSIICDFYDTHHRIDKTECGLNEELEILLQLCKDVKAFLTQHDRHLASPHASTDKLQLLRLALEYLEKEVKVYNEKVYDQTYRSSPTRRALRLMWNRPDWVEITARMTSHKISLSLAFHMIAIDLAQAESLEARIAYQEVSARMTSLKKRQQSDQGFSASRSRQRVARPTPNGAGNKFISLAQQVYDGMSRTMSPAERRQPLPHPPNEDGTSGVPAAHRENQACLLVPRQESTPDGSSNTRVPLQENSHAVLDYNRDDLHDKDMLLAAVRLDQATAQDVLQRLEREREPDGRLSQKSLMELEQAHTRLDAAVRRSTWLQTQFNFGLTFEEHKKISKDLSRINELRDCFVDAADNLVNILSLEDAEDEVIRIKLKVTRLYIQAGRLEEALVLIHKTYDSAKSIWHHRRVGIPEMIACLEILTQIHQKDITMADLYRKEAGLFRAWEYIQRNSQPDLSRYLREYRDSPLAYAASKGLVDDVEHLLGANPELLTRSSVAEATPLIAAAHEKHEEVVKAILDANRRNNLSDINETDSYGDSALHAAQMPPSLGFYGRYDNCDWREVANSITASLLDAGANIALPNKLGQCALHIAAEQRNREAMRTILSKSHELINAQDESMSTPLHIAIERGHLDIVQFLVDEGANIRIQDNQGHDAVDLAKDPLLHDLRNDQIISLLKARQRELQQQDTGSAASAGGRNGILSRMSEVRW